MGKYMMADEVQNLDTDRPGLSQRQVFTDKLGQAV